MCIKFRPWNFRFRLPALRPRPGVLTTDAWPKFPAARTPMVLHQPLIGPATAELSACCVRAASLTQNP
jgi:hypothetical protein